jgi:hypothetical protein
MGASKRTASRLLVALGLLPASLVMASIAWASHASIEISIPLDTVVRAPEGSTTQLASVEVPSEFVGHLCEVRARSENPGSVHPNNDIEVESGNSQLLLPDVEAGPGHVVEAEGLLELGEVMTVSLVMGPDEVFSAGIEIIVHCVPEETTTTTEVPQTTTTVEVTPTEETTTTVEVTPTEETTTTVEVTTTEIEDEVLGTEVLPFTGSEETWTGLLALALLATGLLLVAATRSTGD